MLNSGVVITLVGIRGNRTYVDPLKAVALIGGLGGLGGRRPPRFPYFFIGFIDSMFNIMYMNIKLQYIFVHELTSIGGGADTGLLA